MCVCVCVCYVGVEDEPLKVDSERASRNRHCTGKCHDSHALFFLFFCLFFRLPPLSSFCSDSAFPVVNNHFVGRGGLGRSGLFFVCRHFWAHFVCVCVFFFSKSFLVQRFKFSNLILLSFVRKSHKLWPLLHRCVLENNIRNPVKLGKTRTRPGLPRFTEFYRVLPSFAADVRFLNFMPLRTVWKCRCLPSFHRVFLNKFSGQF